MKSVSFIPRDYRLCIMSRRHHLDTVPPPLDKRGPEWKNVIFWLCDRCDTEREDEVDTNTGDVVHVSYIHTPEYKEALKDFRAGNVTHGDLRLDLMSQLRKQYNGRLKAERNTKK